MNNFTRAILVLSIIGLGVIFVVSSNLEEMNIRGLNETERDRAELITRSLEMALVEKRFPGRRPTEEKGFFVLSSKNMPRGFIPRIHEFTIVVLDVEDVGERVAQGKLDIYLEFETIDLKSPEIALVKLGYVIPMGGGISNLGGIAIFFSKEAGSWDGKVGYGWIT